MIKINSASTLNEYEKLIKNQDAGKLAKALAKDLPARNAKGIITKDKVEQLAKKYHYAPLLEAFKSYKALKNIPGSMLHDREALSLALFIEGPMKGYTAKGQVHFERIVTGIPRTIEYNRTTGKAYVIFKENGAPLIGKGTQKIVYRACEYNRAASRLVAYAEGPKKTIEPEIHNMNLAKALGCVIQAHHVISFKDLQTKQEKMGMVLPYYSSGPLTIPLIKSLSQDQKLKLMRDCAKGVQGLHSRNIVHSDITMWNIFVQKSVKGIDATVADLGLSRSGNNLIEHNLFYNLTAREPPERFLSARKIDARKRDVYALGGIFFKVLYNQAGSWETNEYAKSIDNFRKAPNKARPDLYNRFSVQVRNGIRKIEQQHKSNKNPRFVACQAIVRAMLEPDPAKRPDMNQIAARLNAIH
jgi:serine/threonine protein kinase